MAKRKINGAVTARRASPKKVQQPTIIERDRLGKVVRWEFYKQPVEGPTVVQDAYRQGFETRINDFMMGRAEPETRQWRRRDQELAFMHGYEAARLQEPK